MLPLHPFLPEAARQRLIFTPNVVSWPFCSLLLTDQRPLLTKT